MKKLLFIILFALPAHFLFSQENDELLSEEVKKNQVLFTPRFMDFVNPGIEVNYARLYGNNNNFSTLISITYLNDILNFFRYEDFNGFRVGLEEKFFFSRKGDMGGFIAGELVYYNSKIRLIHHFNQDISNDPNVNYIDTFSIKKKMAFFNLKGGVQILVNPLIFEINLGLGIKYKDIEHFERKYPNDNLRKNDLYITKSALEEFKGYTLNLPINLKMGFTF